MARKPILVRTRSTASQTEIRDDFHVVPTTKHSLAPSDGERAGVRGRPSSLLDTRVVYCGDNLEQLAKLPDACVDLIYIEPPFNSNRNYGQSLTGTVWGETKEKRAFEDRHENTKAYIDYLRRAACNSPASSNRPAALLPLRLARQPLRQGHARPDFRRK